MRISLILDVVIYDCSLVIIESNPCYRQEKRSNILDKKHTLHTPITFETSIVETSNRNIILSN